LFSRLMEWFIEACAILDSIPVRRSSRAVLGFRVQGLGFRVWG